MTKDNSTGKNKEFYDLGKKMFDRINPLGHTTSRWSGKIDRTTPAFQPDYNTEAVLVEEMQRMAKEIEDLHKILITRAEQIVGLQDEIRNLTGEE